MGMGVININTEVFGFNVSHYLFTDIVKFDIQNILITRMQNAIIM
jgi:hypothetical protein